MLGIFLIQKPPLVHPSRAPQPWLGNNADGHLVEFSRETETRGCVCLFVCMERERQIETGFKKVGSEKSEIRRAVFEAGVDIA